MTKTALAMREIKSREGIESRKLEHEAAQRDADRQVAREGHRAQKVSALIGSAGRVASKVLPGLKFNDPAWYKKFLTNLDDFTRIPTYDRLGAMRFGERYARDGNTSYAVPGIMVFRWLPMTGPQCSYMQSNPDMGAFPINQTLARFKERVLALNSRSSVTWEGPDLGLNIYCSSDLFTMVTELGRVIKVYNTYHASNRYLAESLIKALGWSFSDMVSHYADYRKAYNLWAKKLNNGVVVPSEMSLLARRLFLASNIFIDSHNTKYPRQMYAYVEGGHFRLYEDGSGADWVSLTDGTQQTISSFNTQMSAAYQALVDNPDFIEMYQDLRHAFKDKIFQIPDTVTGEVIEFNDADLNKLQIHNIKMLPLLTGTVGTSVATLAHTIGFMQMRLGVNSSGYLYQGTFSGTNLYRYADTLTVLSPADLVKYREFVLSYYGSRDTLLATNVGPGKQMFNSYSDEVTGDEILDISRIYPTSDFVDNAIGTGGSKIYIEDCGTEIVEYANIITFNQNNEVYVKFSSCHIVLDAAVETLKRITYDLGFASAFDWCPIVNVGIYNATSNKFEVATFMDGVTTFTIDNVDGYKLHEACVLSELFVEGGEFSRY